MDMATLKNYDIVPAQLKLGVQLPTITHAFCPVLFAPCFVWVFVGYQKTMTHNDPHGC